MDEILVNIERQLSAFHVLDVISRSEDNLSDTAPGFVSMIKLNGKPIPPPVMTQQKRLEMRQLRSKAVQREQELANQRRSKLLEKVQTIVNGIEERRSSSRASQVDDTSSPTQPEDDSVLNSDNLPETGDNPTNYHTEADTTPITMKQLSGRTKGDSETSKVFTNLFGGVASAQGSTSSSSDASLLNQTVVAASDFSPSGIDDASRTPVETKQDKVLSLEQDISYPSFNKDSTGASFSLLPESNTLKLDHSCLHPVSKSPEIISQRHDQVLTTFKHMTNVVENPGPVSAAASVKLACSWNKETEEKPESLLTSMEENPTVSKFNLMPSLIGCNQNDEDDFEPFGERESYLSLLGEYSSLPMPTRSSHFFSDVSTAPSSTPLENPSPILIEKSSETSPKISAEDFPKSLNNVASPKEDESSMFISTSSTLLTNTVGMSCTLPSSLRTVSAASTLQDVDDPWNTLIETPVPTKDFENPLDISVPRGTPVGQENSPRSYATNVAKTTKVSPNSLSSENEFSSPEKRVRRNSYTLDHPSPALLNAQARNEAPHANFGDRESEPLARRSLDDDAKEPEKTVESGGQQIDQNQEPTEENLLHLQLQYFEEMRQHLEQQQRQQLQQLLIEQQQAQMALQQEMAQLERRFRQQQQQHGSIEEERGPSRESMPGMVGAGVETKEDVPTPTTLPPANVSSKKSTPNSAKSSQHTPSQDIPSKHTSPSDITKDSPANNSLSTAGSGGRAEPFYLVGDQGRLVGGASDSPTTARSPGVGENVGTPVMICSPFNKKQINSPTMKRKFDKISAAAKGYLTRRIFRTHRVQSIIKTIKDTVTFADKFISETPIKKGGMSMQDMVLAERVLAQVQAAQYDLYDIFFTMPVSQRMGLIEQSKRLNAEGGQKEKASPEQDKAPPRPLSAATLKALERKRKAKEAEARLFGDHKSDARAGALSSRSRPVSAAEGRILKPLLSQRSPARPKSTNTYRPSNYGIVNQEPPKSKESKKSTHDPEKPKVISHRAPGNTTQGGRSTKTRSSVNIKTKGVRRSLYPIANPSKKVQRRTTDVRK